MKLTAHDEDKTGAVTPADSSVISVRDVRKLFKIGGRFSGGRQLTAVDGVSLNVTGGTTYGVVGESGCGKSTLARLITRLVDVSSGDLFFDGQDVTRIRGQELRQFRRNVQMVFQDPYSSFDPTSPLSATVLEPLQALAGIKRPQRRATAEELFELVGLRAMLVDRYPNELSGGQLQRAAIARALATRPKLVVLDEPVSALDLSTKGQVINLLEDLQRDLDMTYILIAHDLAVVRHACHRVAVLHLGQVVEEGPTEVLYEHPAHPYTLALLSAIPQAGPRGNLRPRIILQGELPSPISPPSGCRFRTRCPWAMDICTAEDPPAYTTPLGATVRCHLHTAGPRLSGESVTKLLTADGGSAQRLHQQEGGYT